MSLCSSTYNSKYYHPHLIKETTFVSVKNKNLFRIMYESTPAYNRQSREWLIKMAKKTCVRENQLAKRMCEPECYFKHGDEQAPGRVRTSVPWRNYPGSWWKHRHRLWFIWPNETRVLCLSETSLASRLHYNMCCTIFFFKLFTARLLNTKF